MRKIISPDVSFFTKGNMCNTIPGERLLVSRGKKVAGLDAQQRRPRTAMGVNQKGVDRPPGVLNTPVSENIPGCERAVANHLGI